MNLVFELIIIRSKRMLLIIGVLIFFELIGRQKSFLYLISFEHLSYFSILASQLWLNFSLAQNIKMIPIIRGFHKEWYFTGWIASLKFVEWDDLIEQQHRVQIPISFPYQTWWDLAKSFRPLFNSQFLMFVKSSLWLLVPLLYFQHVKNEFFV